MMCTGSHSIFKLEVESGSIDSGTSNRITGLILLYPGVKIHELNIVLLLENSTSVINLIVPSGSSKLRNFVMYAMIYIFSFSKKWSQIACQLVVNKKEFCERSYSPIGWFTKVRIVVGCNSIYLSSVREGGRKLRPTTIELSHRHGVLLGSPDHHVCDCF